MTTTKKTLTTDDFKVGQRVRYTYDSLSPFDCSLNGEGVVTEIIGNNVRVKYDDGRTYLLGMLQNFEILSQPKPDKAEVLPAPLSYKSWEDTPLAQLYRCTISQLLTIRAEIEARGFTVTVDTDTGHKGVAPSNITHVYIKKIVTEKIEL